MSHAIVIFGSPRRFLTFFASNKLHVRSGNDNNGSFCWGNLREHETGERDGSYGKLRIGACLLRRHGSDDPQAVDHHRGPHAEVQVAAGM